MDKNNDKSLELTIDGIEIPNYQEATNALLNLQHVKNSHPYKLTLTDKATDTTHHFYLNDRLYDELYNFLKTYHQKTDTTTNQPYIITKKEITKQTPEEFKKFVNENKTSQQNEFILPKDFLIVSAAKIKECHSKNHDIQEIETYIPFRSNTGNYTNRKIKAYYCKHCNLYLINEYIYNNHKQSGIFLCQHMTLDEYEQLKDAMQSKFCDMKEESLLKRYGYTVSSTEGLSSAQRQSILSYVIENKIEDFDGKTWDREYTTWFIKKRIELAHKRDDMEKAIFKWREDLEFLDDKNYNSNNPIVYEVRRLIK